MSFRLTTSPVVLELAEDISCGSERELRRAYETLQGWLDSEFSNSAPAAVLLVVKAKADDIRQALADLHLPL